MMKRTSVTAALTLAAVLLAPGWAGAQDVPAPVEHFGFELGSHRKLANWSELTAYYEKVAQASPRVALDTLGQTTMGMPFVMLTITSPENHANLDELHAIQMKLADPRRIADEAELERLVRDGKAVVLITHAIHSTEVGSAQTAARLAHRLATSDDPGIRRILDEVILLQIPSLNPDGTEWVVDWYNRWVGTEYEAAPLPWLYHFYVGHDNNRDWYAFTQVETQHTITQAHNAWHPHIVHDIHQMGNGGARMFFPPYIDPWEPNIDPALTTSVNQLGMFMAGELTAQGKAGVVVNAIYDAYTPARAYQHYHAGARILSETASARMATPIDQSPDEIRGGRQYDADTRSWNYPWPWEGGEWGLPDIVDYMESGALALLTHAARNREYWLRNFHAIGRRAVDKWPQWPEAWVIPAGQANETGVQSVLRILRMGDVEVHRAESGFQAGGRSFPAGSWVVPMGQPYAAFAQTLLEVQVYPDLREYEGGPPKQPYDVTAHTLGLLMGVETVPLEDPVEVALSEPIPVPEVEYRLPEALAGEDAPRIALYKSWDPPHEEGWTRWVFDQHGLVYDTIHDADVRAGELADRYDVIILQAQSPGSIVNGHSPSVMPPDWAGGIGQEGVAALSSFVRSGGRLVAVEEATDLAVELFDLDVTNPVERLPTDEFFIPGSILRLETEDGDDTVAWFWRSSRAFQVSDPSIRVLARYGEPDPLLSGWVLGAQHVAGRPAIVEAPVGQGSVVLFGFQPNYRAQTIATWSLLFEALSPASAGEAATGGGAP